MSWNMEFLSPMDVLIGRRPRLASGGAADVVDKVRFS